MIGRLKGILIEKSPPQILLDIHGIAYEINMPMTCFYLLPKVNCEIIIFTHFIVREDAQLLFGFNNKQERTLFRELIKVNGIGPKLALAILSGMSASELILAIKDNEIDILVKLPGVGKKTAERLVIEMRDHIHKSNLFFPSLKSENVDSKITNEDFLPQNTKVENEAISALIVLGYKPQEAKRMINKVKHTINTAVAENCETLIREALRTAAL
ncbi:MAG: Holliday junction branch migration protein RuvA [Candidatus Dasytiphilus stammeri]